MEYFSSCQSIEELKKDYKDYCVKFHSDNETMDVLNSQYRECLEALSFSLNIKLEIAAEMSFSTVSHYDWQNDRFADVIQKIIDFDMKIEVIGQWIWCFDSYKYKEQLKELGFWFSKTNKAWVFNGDKKHLFRGRYKIGEIRKKWGSEIVRTKEDENA